MNIENFSKELEVFFLALADGTRLRLLNLMRQDEVCVCLFTEVLRESQPKISRHLAYLKNAGIVAARREGKWMHYRILTPVNTYVAKLLRDTLEAVGSNDQMRADYQRLNVICQAAEVPMAIARAPKPYTFAKADVYSGQKAELETFLL